MATSSPNNDGWAETHPLEMLEAYALDALDEEQSLEVEFHLDWCGPCGREVARLQQGVAPLAVLVDRTEPSEEVLDNLLEALGPGRPFGRTGNREAANSFWVPVARFLLPVAAMLMVGLFSAALVLNFRVSDRTENLEQENSTLVAQVALSLNENQLMEDKLNQLQLASYWLANPANQPLALNSAKSDQSSKGVMLLAKDGSGAMILISGMKDRSPTSTYQVWLMRQGNRVLAARVKVDDHGWGTTAFWPNESLFRFDKIELVSETVVGGVSTSNDMVMEAKIPGPLPSQMLAFPPWQ